jgi:hypothetical protein
MAADRQIEALVCELCGLTEEEIAFLQPRPGGTVSAARSIF